MKSPSASFSKTHLLAFTGSLPELTSGLPVRTRHGPNRVIHELGDGLPHPLAVRVDERPRLFREPDGLRDLLDAELARRALVETVEETLFRVVPRRTHNAPGKHRTVLINVYVDPSLRLVLYRPSRHHDAGIEINCAQCDRVREVDSPSPDFRDESSHELGDDV